MLVTFATRVRLPLHLSQLILIRCLSSMEKPAFQQVILLRVKVVYCFLAAFALAIIAALDYLNQELIFALVASSFSFLLAIYAIYLLFRRRRKTAPYIEWTLTLLLGSFTIVGMQQDSFVAQWVYFFPVYVFFLFPFKIANYIMLTYSLIIILVVLSSFDSYIRLQLLLTFLACYTFTFAYALVNERKKMMLSNFINTDSLTQVYNEHQLYHDLNKEISRADRQRTGLTLIAIRLPATWQSLKTEEYENRIANAGHRVRSNIRIFDTSYRLNTDDFIIMLPNTNQEDGEALYNTLRSKISQSKHAAKNKFLINTVTYGPEDDYYSLLKRATSEFERLT